MSLANAKSLKGLDIAAVQHVNCAKQVIVRLDEGLPDLHICIEDHNLNCGWLLNQVTKRYAMLFE
jgi:hypothetical protein